MKLVEERSELPIIEIFMFSRCRGRISQSLCYSGHRSQVEESEEDDPGSDIDRKKGGSKNVRKKIVVWILQVKGVQSKLLLI